MKKMNAKYLTAFGSERRILSRYNKFVNHFPTNLEKNSTLATLSSAQKWVRGAVAAVGISAAAISSASAAGVSSKGSAYTDPLGFKQVSFQCENDSSGKTHMATADRNGIGNSIDLIEYDHVQGYVDPLSMADKHCRKFFPDLTPVVAEVETFEKCQENRGKIACLLLRNRFDDVRNPTNF